MTLENESTTAETADAPAAEAAQGGDTNQAAQDDGHSKSPGAEAARYRVARNEARAERDALAARVETLQSRELERIASKSLSNPADLLTLSGKSLQDFIGEDGELDTELVIDVANDLLGSRPGLRPSVSAVDRSQGSGSTAPSTPTDFSGLLNNI
jgi:hypothetical protein